MADVLSILSIQVGNFVGKLRSLEYEKTGNQASRPSPVSARTLFYGSEHGGALPNISAKKPLISNDKMTEIAAADGTCRRLTTPPNTSSLWGKSWGKKLAR